MTLRKRISSVLLLLICCVAYASAHPLGNFTINHFARLEIQNERIRIHYVIDMAEIPAFQELQKLGTTAPSQEMLDAYAQRVTDGYPQNLILTIDGAQMPLSVVSRKIALREGAGAMQTMRIECDLESLLARSTNDTHSLEFEDKNYAERLGWREIVVSPKAGISVFDSSAYAGSISNELLNYPGELLAAPLDERHAKLQFTPGLIPSGAQPLQMRQGGSAERQSDRLATLIAVPNLTIQIALYGLLFAAFLGAVHAMSPGHGKAVVAAYLVGSRGTARHAAFLGITVTITHTAGVFALGLATLLASEYVVPERLYPKISLISGLAVIAIGFNLLMRRLSALIGVPRVHDDDHHHHHTHEHGDVHHHHHHGGVTHSHHPPGFDGSTVTWRSLLALGISGGILPCPSALVVLLAAISLHRVGYGLILVLAFSVGLAATLTTVGLLFVYAGRWLKGNGKFYRLTRVLPVASALVIVTAGAAICYAALNQNGYSISEVIYKLSARLVG